MKKILVGLILTASLAVPLAGLAIYNPTDLNPPSWGEVDVMDALGSIVNWLFILLLVIAAAAITIAGYLFVTATGDPDKTKRARDFVLYALIGIIVGLVAKGLVYFINSIVR